MWEISKEKCKNFGKWSQKFVDGFQHVLDHFRCMEIVGKYRGALEGGDLSRFFYTFGYVIHLTSTEWNLFVLKYQKSPYYYHTTHSIRNIMCDVGSSMFVIESQNNVFVPIVFRETTWIVFTSKWRLTRREEWWLSSHCEVY